MNITIVLSCLELSSLIYNGTKVSDKFTLINSYEGNLQHPCFLVAKRQEDLFVVIRGESSFTDIESMMDFMPIVYNSKSQVLNNLNQQNSDLFVTSGVFKSAQNIIQKIQHDISSCTGKIYFTGHSYGGSVAAMAAMLIRLNYTAENGINSQNMKSNYNLRTFAITFGSYPCVSPLLSQFSRRFITGFVVNHDIFPSMNPHNINNILDSIVQRGTSQAKSGAARVTLLFAQLGQYFTNRSQTQKIDISRKSLEMTLKLVKTAPKAAKIKMVNAGLIYHIFDDFDLNKKEENIKKPFFKKLFKVDEHSDINDKIEKNDDVEITQFNEDVEYGNLMEMLSGISDHYINSYCKVIEKAQNSKFPYFA